MPGELTWILDERRLSGSRGMSVFEAAEAAGIEIPHLCRGAGSAAEGRCRLCTAMINGRPRATCTEPLADGMRVEFDTPELRDLRRTIVEILLAECGDGSGELESLASQVGADRHAFGDSSSRSLRENGPGSIVVEHAHCIMCGRCVRASGAAGVPGLIRLIGRGPGRRVWIDDQCGAGTGALRAAVAACPTGALRSD